MKLVLNDPIDTHRISELVSDPKDLQLLSPGAASPFDHDEWQLALDPVLGHKSFFLVQQQIRIGHAALCVADDSAWDLCFVFVWREHRGRGIGRTLISLVEDVARRELAAKSLRLKVRTYNPAAHRCYEQCGFVEFFREDTLIRMRKDLEG